MLTVVKLNVIILNVIMLNVIVLNVIMLNANMLNVIMLYVIILNVVAQQNKSFLTALSSTLFPLPMDKLKKLGAFTINHYRSVIYGKRTDIIIS
jgi:hypothetical protein